MHELRGKIVLVTGGTSGIGEAAVRQFVLEGAIVAFTGRREELGHSLQHSLGPEVASFIPCDHSLLSDCENAVRFVMDKYHRIDVLFNNAGIVLGGTAEETSEEDWARIMNVNVTSVWRMCRLVIPIMRSQGGGSIVNNASDWGLVGGRGYLAYVTSKGAVVLMTKALALDHGKDKIRVNAVCPGDTAVSRWATSGYHEGGESVPETEWSSLGSNFALGRVGRPEEIAKVVVFLAGSGSSYMTGAAVPVDG
eukprot:PhF_6_TR10195/c0_g1_i1/m.15808